MYNLLQTIAMNSQCQTEMFGSDFQTYCLLGGMKTKGGGQWTGVYW